LGSAVAALAGAAAGVVAMMLSGWSNWLVCLFMIGIFVVPLWLLVLLPVHVWVPSSSRFWRPLPCTAVGALTGAVLLTVYFSLSQDAPFELIWIFLPIGVLVGGVTLFIGSAIVRHWHQTPMA
jgi:hypothetical protein